VRVQAGNIWLVDLPPLRPPLSSGQTDALCGAEWPSAQQTVKRRGQASAAHLVSVAGHSLGGTKHLLRVDISALFFLMDNSATPRCRTLGTLLCPRPGSVKVAGC